MFGPISQDQSGSRIKYFGRDESLAPLVIVRVIEALCADVYRLPAAACDVGVALAFAIGV